MGDLRKQTKPDSERIHCRLSFITGIWTLKISGDTGEDSLSCSQYSLVAFSSLCRMYFFPDQVRISIIVVFVQLMFGQSCW